MSDLDFYQWFVNTENSHYGSILGKLRFHQNFESSLRQGHIRAIGTPLCIELAEVPRIAKKEKDGRDRIKWQTDWLTDEETGKAKEARERKEYPLEGYEFIYIGPISMYVKKRCRDIADIVLIDSASRIHKYTCIYESRPFLFVSPVYMVLNGLPSIVIVLTSDCLACFSISGDKVYVYYIYQVMDEHTSIFPVLRCYLSYTYGSCCLSVINLQKMLEWTHAALGINPSADISKREINAKNIMDTYFENFKNNGDCQIDSETLLTTELLLDEFCINVEDQGEVKDSMDNITYHAECVRAFDKYCTTRLKREFRGMHIPREFADIIGHYLRRFDY